jgi:hypothetical protein
MSVGLDKLIRAHIEQTAAFFDRRFRVCIGVSRFFDALTLDVLLSGFYLRLDNMKQRRSDITRAVVSAAYSRGNRRLQPNGTLQGGRHGLDSLMCFPNMIRM